MDTSSIGALTGTSETKKKKDVNPGDGDAFASVMGEAQESESEGSKKAGLISKEETPKDKADKADAAKKRDAESKEHQQDTTTADVAKDSKLKPKLNEFLQNTASKDPATLSMAERQLFQVGEFAAQGKSLGGMAQMLASHGIDTSSFSPQQVMSMLSRMDIKEIGKVMSQLQASGFKVDEDSLKALKEQFDLQQNPGSDKTPPKDFNLQEFMSAGTPKDAGEAARQEQRRMVMDQILSNIEVRNVANQTEMNLRLNPEYLGEVKITLFHDDEGGVRARFQTTSKLTSEVLSESKDDLMSQARSKGVRLGSMDVAFVDELSA